MKSFERKITRRDFLKSTAVGAALTLAGKPVFSNAQEGYDLAVISGDPVVATRKALEVIGGISRFVKKGQRVVLKPNMSFPNRPKRAATPTPW